jgi:hypothetical protein
VEKPWVKENNRERERLARLVNEISDGELKLVIYKEGWTVAVALAHLAFWDERRRLTLKIWKQKGMKAVSVMGEEHIDIINDTLLPFLLSIQPDKAAESAIASAETLDRELEELSPEMITAIESLQKPYILNRSVHRQMHLDEIEAFLKNKRRSL